jgi:hypothetical protein
LNKLLKLDFARAFRKAACLNLLADFIGEAKAGWDVVYDYDWRGFIGGHEFDILEAEEAQAKGLDDAYVLHAVKLERFGGSREETPAGEEALGRQLELLPADGEPAAKAVDDRDANEADARRPKPDDEAEEEDAESGHGREEEWEGVLYLGWGAGPDGVLGHGGGAEKSEVRNLTI